MSANQSNSEAEATEAKESGEELTDLSFHEETNSAEEMALDEEIFQRSSATTQMYSTKIGQFHIGV